MSVDPVTAVSDFLATVVGAVTKAIPDTAAREAALTALATLKETDSFNAQLAQLQIDLADAKSGKIFQAGWRPALAWTCVVSFVYHFLIFNFAVLWLPNLKDISTQDFAVMMGVLTVLIGARTIDKVKGVDS